MPVRFSTRAPNSDYLGLEASPEAIVAAAKQIVWLGHRGTPSITCSDEVAILAARPIASLSVPR